MPTDHRPLSETHILDLNLRLRARNTLQNLGLETLQDLLALSQEEFRAKVEGTKTYEEVCAFLAEHDLEWAPAQPKPITFIDLVNDLGQATAEGTLVWHFGRALVTQNGIDVLFKIEFAGKNPTALEVYHGRYEGDRDKPYARNMAKVEGEVYCQTFKARSRAHLNALYQLDEATQISQDNWQLLRKPLWTSLAKHPTWTKVGPTST